MVNMLHKQVMISWTCISDGETTIYTSFWIIFT